MSCTIEYNKDNKIKRVNTPNGTESTLFTELAKIPHVKSLEDALAIYKNVYSKSVGVYYNIIGEKGAKNLDNIQNTTFRIDNLRVAEEMEQNGKAPKDIKLATGWEKGADNKWKYEISYGNVKNKTLVFDKENFNFSNTKTAETTLGEIYDHAELYESFPQLKESPVIFYEDSGVFGESYMFEHEGTIYINKKEFVNEENKFTEDFASGQGKNSLQHEVQHLLQNIEGFATGSNLEWNRLSIINSISYIRDRATKDELRDGVEGEYDKYLEQYVRRKFSKEVADFTLTANDEKIEFIADYLKTQMYLNFMGEVEARNVQRRFNISPEDRGTTLLEETEDIEREFQIDFLQDFREQQLNFKSDSGNQFSTFKEALKDSKGGDIEVMVEDKVLATISSNTNKNTEGGLINYLIKNDVLSDQRIIENGESYLKAEGYGDVKQVVNELLIKDEVPTVKVYRDGRVEIKQKEEFKPTSQQEIFLDKVGAVVKDAQPKPYGTPQAILSEDALKSRLMDFLVSIGVEVTSIEKYVEKYKIKNGVEPSAEGLADISNQVVAFREGVVDIASLSEEAAHFIVEGWNEAEIENLLRNIHKTNSYKNNSEIYREIYTRENPNMSAQEIENLVRKEVLGKELAVALQTRFNTPSEQSQSIWSKMYELLIKFFDSVVLKDNYKEQLDTLTEKVEDMLLNKDVERYINTQQFKNKKFKLYSVAPSSATQAQRNLIKTLTEQEKALRATGRGSTSTLQNLERMLSQEIAKKSVQDLIGLAKRQTNYIKEAVKEANKKNTTMSAEENMVFHNLNNAIRPALSQLQVSLANDPEYKNEVSDIEAMVSQINKNEGLVLTTETKILDKVVDRLMKRYDLQDGTIILKDANNNDVTVNVREHLIDSIKTAKKDTNAVYSYFGQITHAQDPLLNMLGNVIGDMYTEAGQSHMKRAKDFQKKIREKGYFEKDLAQLAQEDGYLISEFDFVEAEDFRKYAQAFAYKTNLSEIVEVTKEKIANGEKLETELKEHESFLNLSDEAFLDKFEGIPVITDETLKFTVISEAQSIINKGSEAILSEEYIEKQEKLYTDSGISDITRIKLKSFSEMRAQIKRNTVKSKNGVSIYTTQNKYDLEFLNIERRKTSSPYNENGELKQGLSVVTEEPTSGEYVKLTETSWIVIDRENANEEAVISFDMNKMTRNFIDEKNKGESFNEKLDPTTHSKWYADLEAMENDPEVSREDIITWFNLNTQVGFSKEFFQNSDKQDIFEEFLQDEEIAETIEDYKNLLQKRRVMVNQYRDPNNGVNTSAESIPASKKQEIIALSEEIYRKASEVFMYIKGKNKEKAQEIEQEMRSAETGANEAYFGALLDNGLETFEEKLDYTLKHVTASNRIKIQEYRQAVTSGFVPNKLSALVEKYGMNEEGILKYAQSRLVPYYSSYAPIALQEFYSDVRNTEVKMSELIDKLNSSEDVRISVSYDYLDNQDSEILNPNRRQDFEGGYFQPSLTKQPTVFNRTFNFNNKNWNKVKSNPKLKELYDTYLEYHRDTLKSYGLNKIHNIYQLPQVSKTRLNKFENLVKGKGIGATANEWLMELVNFRNDELVQGEEQDGKSLFTIGIKVIPKFFINKLENVNDVSTDLFYSSTMMAQQAELYKSRKEKYAELSSIEEAFLKRTYPEGKLAESTNSFRMAKSYLDYALFGVQESARLRVTLPLVGQKDLTKTINTIHRWKQNISLALNPIVPVTSALTAHTQLFMERLVTQYVDGDSANKSMAEFRKIGAEGVSEALDINSKSRISILGEYFGIFDLDTRFENSQYSSATRLFGKSLYVLHTAGNYTPLSQGMLSVLYGQRVVGDKLLDFAQYKERNVGKNIKDIEASWKNEKPLYDYIDTSTGTVTYLPTLKDDLGVTDEEFRNLELGVIAKGKKIVERIDGQIKPEERTALQRHFLMKFTGTHKGWLMIATANRFKVQHLNWQTGQLEEGTYISGARYFGNVISQLAGFNPKAFQDAYIKATPMEKQNLRRIAFEVGVLSAVYALGIALVSYADDEEEPTALIQASAYLTDRLINETNSSQFGVIGEMYNSIKQPVVGLQQVMNAGKVHELIAGDEIITRGRYKNLSERERYVIRTVVGAKVFYDLSSAENLKSQRQSYEFFSKDSEAFNPIAYLLTKDDFKEENEE